MMINTTPINYNTENIEMSFGERLKEIRKKRGYTQDELAKLLNKSIPQYRKYESGDSLPPLNTVITLAETLNITTDELIIDPEKRKPIAEEENFIKSIKKLDNHQKEILKEITEALLIHQSNQKFFKETR